MKLKPMGTPGVAPAHVKPWTQQEDELLATLYHSHTAPELTKHLQRNRVSNTKSHPSFALSGGYSRQTPPPEHKRTQHAHQESPHKNYPGTSE